MVAEKFTLVAATLGRGGMAWRKECKVSSDIPRQGQEFDRLLRSTVGALSLENAEQDTLKHAQSMLWDYQATPEMSAPPQRIR